MNIELRYADKVEQVEIPTKVILPVIPHPGYPSFAEETWGDHLEVVREAKNKIPSFQLTKHGGLILFNLRRDPKNSDTFSCVGESLCVRVDEEKGTIHTSFHQDVQMSISLMYHSADYEFSATSVGESPWWDGVSIDVVVHAEKAVSLKEEVKSAFLSYYPAGNVVIDGCERYLIPDVSYTEVPKGEKPHSVMLYTSLGFVKIPLRDASEYALLLAPNDDSETCGSIEYLPCSIPLFQTTQMSRFRLNLFRVPAHKGCVLLTDFCLITQQENIDIKDRAGRPVESFTARAYYIGASPSESNFYESFDPEDLSLNVLSTRCVYGRIFRPHPKSAHLAPKGFVIMTMVFPDSKMDLSFPIDAEKLKETLRMVPVPKQIDAHNGAFGRSPAAERARKELKDGTLEGLQTLRLHYEFSLYDVQESCFLDPPDAGEARQ